MKFAVGIPTYFEADNIAFLVRKIDEAAKGLKQDILIINSDNESTDSTQLIFQNTLTKSPKIALNAPKKGKGNNVRRILDYVDANKIDYCLLIDGDIVSFDDNWLSEHMMSAMAGHDLVVPRYSRNYVEGNTTNHFAYPVLAALTGGISPRQPIAGDFGISRKYASYLVSYDWPKPANGYGIDIFLTMTALFRGFSVKEIELKQKIHKPSFDKFTSMFTEIAETYYYLRQTLDIDTNIIFSKSKNGDALLDCPAIPLSRINALATQASSTLKKNTGGSLKSISAKEWAQIIAKHEALVGVLSPKQIAESITPYMLIRACTYLKSVKDPSSAMREIDLQANLIAKALIRVYE